MRYAIPINESQTRKTLDEAIRSGAQILVEPTAGPNQSLLGILEADENNALTIALTGPGHRWLPELIGRHCSVQMWLHDRYVFNAPVLDAHHTPRGAILTIEKPRTLQVVQRRRFWRTKLARSSGVILRVGSGCNGANVRATLLNISRDGLACLVAPAAASSLRPGTKLIASFELPDGPRPFRFPATICNQSTTSDNGCILGMQFDCDEADTETTAMQDDLRDFLYRPQPAMAPHGD